MSCVRWWVCRAATARPYQVVCSRRSRWAAPRPRPRRPGRVLRILAQPRSVASNSARPRRRFSPSIPLRSPVVSLPHRSVQGGRPGGDAVPFGPFTLSSRVEVYRFPLPRPPPGGFVIRRRVLQSFASCASCQASSRRRAVSQTPNSLPVSVNTRLQRRRRDVFLFRECSALASPLPCWRFAVRPRPPPSRPRAPGTPL